jgi:hypothetical protein
VAAIVENLVTAAFTVVALGLTVIAVRAYRYSESRKVLLLATGFFLFLVKGAMLSAGLFFLSPWEQLLLPSIVFDLAILGVFYGAVLA